MKRMHVLRSGSLTISWLVLAALSPALLAEAAGDFASRLSDALEQQGWEVQQAPDGSLIYHAPQAPAPDQGPAAQLRQMLEREGWRIEGGADGSLFYWPPRVTTPPTPQPATAEVGPATQTGEVQERTAPPTKPAMAVPEEAAQASEKPATPPPTTVKAPEMAKEPVTPLPTAAPLARPPEAKTKSSVDEKTASPSGAASRTPMPAPRLRAPQRPGYYGGYYGRPMYRPVPPARYRSPYPGYRSARPPCPRGPWDYGSATGVRPGSQTPRWQR